MFSLHRTMFSDGNFFRYTTYAKVSPFTPCYPTIIVYQTYKCSVKYGLLRRTNDVIVTSRLSSCLVMFVLDKPPALVVADSASLRS